jgi:hypothetical protein
MAYESGQYINEFLNNAPNLLLTMRKMDVDQMLETRKLDQVDIDQNLKQQTFDFESLIRNRQMAVLESESAYGLGERKKLREEAEAQKKMMKPIHQAMLKKKKLEEAMERERSDLSWWDKASRIEKRGEGFGFLMGDKPGRYDPASSKAGQVKPWQLTEEELIKSRAEESLGVKPGDILMDKFIPSGATQFEQMLEAGGGNLYPGSVDYMLQHPTYGPKMSTSPELLDLLKSGLMSNAGPLALTQGY